MDEFRTANSSAISRLSKAFIASNAMKMFNYPPQSQYLPVDHQDHPSHP
jgi:hypothetical protein